MPIKSPHENYMNHKQTAIKWRENGGVEGFRSMASISQWQYNNLMYDRNKASNSYQK